MTAAFVPDHPDRRRAYEVAALRLLLGALTAYHEVGPQAREELLNLLAPERR